MSAARTPEPLPPLTRLPGGRHNLSREAVEGSQRERMLVAMLQSVAVRGYAATTVADVVGAAAVSRSTFYANYADKEACFVAAYGYAMDRTLAHLSEAAKSLQNLDWHERLRSDIATYMEALAEEPALAATLHVEVLAAGPTAIEHRAQMLGLLASRIAQLNEQARAQQPELPEVPPAAFALYTGGLDELIRDRLRTAGPEQLRDLVEPVLAATRALFGAPPAG